MTTQAASSNERRDFASEMTVRFAQLLQWAIPTLLTAVILVYLFMPFRTSAYPGVFMDFFNYLLAAKHIVAGQGSGFDGIHPTNGYHPLWMLVSVAMTALFKGRALFIAFVLLISGLLLWTYTSMVACLRLSTSFFVAQCVAAYLVLNFLDLAGGMEIALALPLLFFLCRYRLLYFRWEPL